MSRLAAPLLAGFCALAAAGCSAPEVPAREAPDARAPSTASGGGTIHFSDVSRRAAGLDVVQVGGGAAADWIIDSLGCGAAWLDHDGDGDPDLYLAQGATPEAPRAGPPDRLLRNDGDPDGDGVPAFTDVTRAAGLGDTLWSFGVAVADYDGDGDADIYVTNQGPNRLYRNDGDGTFTEIAALAGVADPSFGSSAAWSDTDRDGDLDLYVVNYVEFDFERYPRRGETPAGDASVCLWKGLEIFCGPRNLEPAPDRFYRNDGDADGDGIPAFVEATAAAGLDAGTWFGLAAAFFDADDDGDDDLYVANDSVQNAYYVNRGDGTFEETAILAGLAYDEQGGEQAGMGIAVADYDGDGRLDLAVSNFSHDHDTLYRNEGDALFRDTSFPSGIGSPSFFALGWGVVFADFDHDAREDLFFARGHVYPQVDGADVGTTFRQRNAVFQNLGDGTFEEVTARAGDGLAPVESSRALLPVDLEGDGDLDLLVTNLNARPQLLQNTGAAGHWLAVRLVGRSKNREGIGARVTLSAGGRRQMREVRRTASYLASTLPVAHFGLGEAASVERLEVRWPSGAASVLEDVAADRLVTLSEADAAGAGRLSP